MTFNQLYPLVQEIIFGDTNRVYILINWEDRKYLGKSLPILLSDLNITIDNTSLEAWDLCIEGIKKYVYFAMPYNFTILVSNLTDESAIIDLRN